MEEKGKKIIQPISFGDVKAESSITIEPLEVVKPIKFTDISKARKPIEFTDISKAVCPIIIEDKFETVLNTEKQCVDIIETRMTSQSVDIIKAQESDKSDETTNTTNYQLYPLYRRIYIRRDGIVDYERNEIEVRIVIDEPGLTFRDTFRIRVADIDKITRIVGRKYPDAILYNKKDAEGVANKLREKCRGVQRICCYLEAGWQMVEGKYVYLHKGFLKAGMEVMTPLGLNCNKTCSINELEMIWRNSLCIYKDSEVAAVLSLYSLLGVTYKLFDEAGYAPHFLLFMTGKTGSFKTTIAKLLYTQLADERYRDYPRRIDADTVTSFERALVVSGVDTVTLIDDYAPAKSQKSAIDLANKLESIIRMVGDGSTKSRSNVNLEDCRGDGIKGMVVLTGELQGKGLSSNLRCLYCEIEREKVNLEVVTWFQKNKDYYCTFIQHFVWFLSFSWEHVKLYIQSNFERYRRASEEALNERRLIDVLATLYTISDIIRLFFIAYCKLPRSKVDTDILSMKRSLADVVKRSEMLSVEEEPALRFMKVVVDMLEKGKLAVDSGRLTEMTISYSDGFWEGDYLYLLPENVYIKVTTYLRIGGLYFGIDREHLGKLLCSEGYAVATSNGKNKQIYYARVDMGAGRKINFLKIPREVILRIQRIMDGKE